MNWFAMVKAVALTLLSTYPFYAVVTELSEKSPEDFEACNEGCIFVRFFGAKGLPATQVRNLDPARPNVFTPAFVLVQNGRNLTWSEYHWKDHIHNPATWPFAYIAMLSVYPSAAVTATVTELQLMKNPVISPPGAHSDAKSFCSSKSARQSIHNHLNDSMSKRLYQVGLLGWGGLKACHDCLLLSRAVSEATTLSIGIASAVFQCLAVGAGFLWTTGGLEVFVAEVEGASSTACYYQLSGLDSLLALATPMLLLYTFLTKWSSLKMAVQYGDYLFCTNYDVPFRIVAATMPRNPMQSLLLPGVAGARTIDPAPYQELSRGSFMVLSAVTNYLVVVYELVLSLAFVFWAPPLYSKLLTLSARHDFGAGVMGMLRIVVALATVAVPCWAVFHICRKLCVQARCRVYTESPADGPRNPSFGERARDVSALSQCFIQLIMIPAKLSMLPAAPAVIITMWEPLFSSPSNAELLHKSWLFAASSVLLASSIIGFLFSLQGPAIVAAQVLQEAYTCDPSKEKFRVSDDSHRELILEHPEWHLIPLLDDEGRELSREKMGEIAAEDPEPDRHFAVLEKLYLNNRSKYEAIVAQTPEGHFAYAAMPRPAGE